MRTHWLMTPRERETYILREQIAALITAGASYKDIEKATGASTATIARVKRLLGERDRWKY